MVICIHCNKDYKTKYTLKAHQTRPSCLKNKIIIETINSCNYCDKVFSRKQNMKEHEKICPLRKKRILESYETLKSDSVVLEDKLLSLEDKLLFMEEKVIFLEEENKALKELVGELQSRPTTVINNDNRKNINIIIKKFVHESPECVTLEDIERYIPKLTHHHILDGGAGYARFFLDIMSERMRMVTKNEARGIVVYKDENKRLKTDIGLREFIVLFSQAIKKPVREIIENLMYSYKEISDENDEDTLKQLAVYVKHIRDISLASEGKTASFIPSMIKGITAGTLASNLVIK